jgi:hypothetical protein
MTVDIEQEFRLGIAWLSDYKARNVSQIDYWDDRWLNRAARN